MSTQATFVEVSGPNISGPWSCGNDIHRVAGAWSVTVEGDGTLVIALLDAPERPPAGAHPGRNARVDQSVRYAAGAWVKYAVYTREIEVRA